MQIFQLNWPQGIYDYIFKIAEFELEHICDKYILDN